MVWYGTVLWYGIYGMVWFSMVQRSVARYGMVWYGNERLRRGAVSYGMTTSTECAQTTQLQQKEQQRQQQQQQTQQTSLSSTDVLLGLAVFRPVLF